jgi:hypothetical protein
MPYISICIFTSKEVVMPIIHAPMVHNNPIQPILSGGIVYRIFNPGQRSLEIEVQRVVDLIKTFFVWIFVTFEVQYKHWRECLHKSEFHGIFKVTFSSRTAVLNAFSTVLSPQHFFKTTRTLGIKRQR